MTQQISKPLVPSLTEEEQMGKQMALEISHQLNLISDPSIEGPLTEIGQRIVAAAGPQPFHFHFYAVESPVFNAFSIPGGYVYFYTGLLVRVRNVDELAGVMAHEIAHVVLHHAAKLMAERSVLNLAAIPAILVALTTGTLPAAFAAQAGMEAQALHSSRAAEREADETGARLARAAGFNPRGMLTFFERSRRELRLGLEQTVPYLLTHPLEEERIHDLEVLVDPNQPWTDGPIGARFRRLQAAVRGMIQGDAAVRTYALETQKTPRSQEAWALLGLAQRMSGDCRAAEGSLDRAQVLGPADADVDSDAGECWLLLGEGTKAMAALRRAAQEDPEDGLRWLRLGRIEEDAGKASDAVPHLMRASSLLGDTIEIEQALGVAYGKLGDLPRAHLHLGRAAERDGDREQALFHFREALTRAKPGSDLAREAQRELTAINAPH